MISPAIESEQKEFETSIEEVLELSYKFYIPWSNIKGEFSQTRRRWINEVMEKYCEIGLAEKSKTVKGKYKIFRDKRFKNIREYMIEKLCKETTKGKTKFLLYKREEENIGQKKLEVF